MTTNTTTTEEKKFKPWIIILSIAIPLAVALLFTIKIPNVEPLSFLPPIYATTNGITAVLLLISLTAIKNKKIALHKRLNNIALILSVAFLVMYVAYHMTSDPTKYGGEGTIKYVYYFILFSHILLSVTVIPFVLVTYVRALTGNFEGHRKIAKITFPIWLYVAVTGVIVYVMISPITRMNKLLITILFFLINTFSWGQCAMCRAVLESETDSNIAEGVNNGIVYLMAFPYILVAGIGFIIYWKFFKVKQ